MNIYRSGYFCAGITLLRFM